MSFMTYWNGAYSGTSSNLVYCAQGTIIGSKNIGSQSVNYATTSGSCSGNAATATKATQDGNGNVIANTYLPLSGGTMTNPIKFSYNNNGDCNVSRNSGFSMFFSNQSGAENQGFPIRYSSVISFMTGYCGMQFATYGGTNDNRLFFRNISDQNVWTPWYTLLHSGNYNSYSPKLDGTGASGTWGISISGNAATATNATNAGYATNAGNSDTVDGCHAGFANGSVAMYVPFPSMTSLKNDGYISSNYEEEGYPDEEFLQGICKWAITTYPDKGDITLMGAIAPSSSGTCILHLYSSSGSDPTTNLPRYCRGLYQQLTAGHLYQFGTYNYVWSYGEISAGYATTAGSAPASDVKAWAKADTKPSYTGSEVTLSGYSKNNSYTPIASGDSVQAAIAKLDGALSGLEALLASI